MIMILKVLDRISVVAPALHPLKILKAPLRHYDIEQSDT
jgi:hypothetical protein